ncbi:PorV/PorQ family protein [candidate division WOR-3 bacterium]|nr:PorV/PorQ family protein [candidate division WOR-3 bacterium]
MKRLLIILCLVPLFLFGEFAKVGIVGAKFLNVGIGTRSMGMAEAFCAVGNNAEAIYWNPAGIALSTGTSVFTDRTNLWAGIGVNSVSVTQNLGFAGVFGFFYSGLSSGKWEETTDDQPLGSGIYVEYRAYQSGISYARFLTDRFSFGLNLKMIKEDYPDHPRNPHDVTGYAVDIGGYYKTEFRDLTIGLCIQHFGADITPSGTYVEYEDRDTTDASREFSTYPLPVTFRGGVAMTVYEAEQLSAILAVDIIHPSDNLERYVVGAEVTILDLLKLRTGYQMGGVDCGVGAFNFGVGVAQKTEASSFELGYSYSYGGELSSLHRMSISLGL